MSERLEEAEGGAESQFNINRNRDAELLKLRKLLDDVHLESEETSHLLKKKHQEIINDFQEQIEILTKTKSRWVMRISFKEFKLLGRRLIECRERCPIDVKLLKSYLSHARISFSFNSELQKVLTCSSGDFTKCKY